MIQFKKKSKYLNRNETNSLAEFHPHNIEFYPLAQAKQIQTSGHLPKKKKTKFSVIHNKNLIKHFFYAL